MRSPSSRSRIRVLRDLRVREALGHEAEHLELARVRSATAREGWVAIVLGGRRMNSSITRFVICRSERSVASSDDVDRRDELLRRRVLEHEAARTVQAPRRRTRRGRTWSASAPGALVPLGEDPPRRLEPVEVRHPDVHQDDIGLQLARRLDRLEPCLRLADDLDPGSDSRIILKPARTRAWSSTIRTARSWHAPPPPHRQGARRSEAAAGTRAPSAARRRERDALAHADQAVARAVVRPLATPVVRHLDLDIAPTYRTATQACAGPACLSAFVSASCTIR